MPSFTFHEAVAFNIGRELGIDNKLFILGSIAPDCWRNSVTLRNMDRSLSHFSSRSDFREDYSRFYYKYKNYLNDPFVFGYLIHLMTDYYWRLFLRDREIIVDDNIYYRLDNGCHLIFPLKSISTVEKDNMHGLDKKMIEYYSIKKLDYIDILTYDSPILEIDMTGLNQTIKYLNELVDEKREWRTPLFKFENIVLIIEDISKKILEEIKRLSINEEKKDTNNLCLIAAVGKNLELGKNNDLIWKFKEDMQFFKYNTINKTIMMGRKTFESLPGKLPDREHIILSGKNIKIPGTTIVHNKNELMNIIKKSPDEVMAIGGGTVYKMLLDDASRLLLTEIEDEDKSADVYFPLFDKSKYRKTVLKRVRERGINYSHVEYKKD